MFDNQGGSWNPRHEQQHTSMQSLTRSGPQFSWYSKWAAWLRRSMVCQALLGCVCHIL
jgi:hypothetical protein